MFSSAGRFGLAMAAITVVGGNQAARRDELQSLFHSHAKGRDLTRRNQKVKSGCGIRRRGNEYVYECGLAFLLELVPGSPHGEPHGVNALPRVFDHYDLALILRFAEKRLQQLLNRGV